MSPRPAIRRLWLPRLLAPALAWLCGCGEEKEGATDAPPCDARYPGEAMLTSEVKAAQFFHRYAGTEEGLVMMDLPDMAVADRLCRVGERLEIWRGGATDLRGLERLEQAGALQLSGMASLEGLAGLSGLELVDGQITLEELPALRSLDGLDRLFAVGSLSVSRTGLETLTWDNPALAMSTLTAGGNDDLAAVDLRLRQIGYLDLSGPALADVSLPDLQIAIRISAASDLPLALSAPALERLDTLSTEADITLDLPAVQAIDTLQLCGSGRGTVGAAGIRVLTLCPENPAAPIDLSALSLPQLAGISQINISDLDATGWPAWPALRSVDGLGITRVTGLPDLRMLQDAPVDTIYLSYADTASLAGLEASTAPSYLALADLPHLSDASALSGLTAVGVYGIALMNLPALHTLDLPLLTSVGSLSISATGLDDLSGLSALSYVGGDLFITGNPGLDQQEIDAFLAHVEVRGTVTVE